MFRKVIEVGIDDDSDYDKFCNGPIGFNAIGYVRALTYNLKGHLFSPEKANFSAEKVPFQHPYFLLL
jgi:hypothetical protein